MNANENEQYSETMIQQNKPKIAKESGWRWVVVLASLVFIAIRTGTERCYSVFYLSLMHKYNIEYAEVSQLMSTFYIAYGCSGILAAPLIKWAGCRACMMTLGIIASVSCFIGSLPGPFWKIVLCNGLIPGVCFGIQVVIAFTAVNQRFKSQLNLANQLICLGFAAGSFLSCPLYQALVENYTVNGALMVISGFYLHTIASGAAMWPLDKKPIAEEINAFRAGTTDEIESTGIKRNGTANVRRASRMFQSVRHSFGLNLFCRPEFYLAVFVYACQIIALSSVFSFLIPCAVTKFSLNKTQASFLPSAEAVGEMIAKFIWGIFFNRIPKRWQKPVVCCHFLVASVLLAILPSVRGFPSLLCICATFGLMVGGIDGFYSCVCIEVFGTEAFAAVFGYTNVVALGSSSGFLLLIGGIIDSTKDPSVAFYFGCGSYVLAAFLLFCLNQRISNSSKKVTNA
uniref:Monocarboxylate transporter 12-like n=1 Tax=Ciona intestinalis TaxID=7719 RepID=F6TL82_CIOIN|nr:monocarboxylate transporter 12-like [Ciona intestinalis]|eukprot:XP_002125230.1 monocarboxylate transporter 12-like [Ciona intestinalis]